MMKRMIVTTLAITALLCGFGTASANEGLLNGHNWMRGKNTPSNSVLIGKRVYELGAHTQIVGLQEERLTLDDLIWVPELESLSRIPRVANLWVEYDATQVGDRLILNWVRLSIDQEGMDQTQMDGVDRYGRIKK